MMLDHTNNISNVDEGGFNKCISDYQMPDMSLVVIQFLQH